MSNILGIRNDERFIYRKKAHKKFKNKMSLKQFNESMSHRALGHGHLEHKVPMIDADLPTYFIKDRYIEKLKQVIGRLEKEEAIKIKEATDRIKEEYKTLKKPLENGIKKLEAQKFLEEVYNLETVPKGSKRDK